ncbi:MAG: hypothetical protein NT012_00695 [Candidatus Nealsonbacteria bacterium]|nr:hypothetical protein [Candidatus Nealsonbacteria bacterium]
MERPMMDEIEIQKKILVALQKSGKPMTSTELEKALGLEWTEFSRPFGKMIQTVFNTGGRVLTIPDPTGRGQLFVLSS